jgi:hypothetical protein
MTSQALQALAHELADLRLPELQARYQQILGAATRCPNKAYLMRQILQALESREENSSEAAFPSSPLALDAATDLTDLTDNADDLTDLADLTDDAEDASASDNDNDNDADPSNPNHEASMTTTMTSDHAILTDTSPAAEPASSEATATRRARRRGQFAGLGIPELQELYRSTLGRSTKSDNAAYMQWKILQAARGKIPTGPRAARAHRDLTTIAIGLTAASLDSLGALARSRGCSRSALIRAAIDAFLAHQANGQELETGASHQEQDEDQGQEQPTA